MFWKSLKWSNTSVERRTHIKSCTFTTPSSKTQYNELDETTGQSANAVSFQCATAHALKSAEPIPWPAQTEMLYCSIVA